MKTKVPELTAPLRRLWLARTPQERKALAFGTLVLFVLLYMWLLQAGRAARSSLEDSVLTLRTQAATLEQQAGELEQFRTMPPVPAADVALLPLVQTAAANAGLTDLLLHSQALDADQVTLSFGAIPFATWLQWIDTLQVQHIRVASTRIETLSTPGLVSVTATLMRPGLQ
jgi:type II secretory pathway component PulM